LAKLCFGEIWPRAIFLSFSRDIFLQYCYL